MKTSEEIAIKMKEIRRRLDLKQTQIAGMAGVGKSYIAHLERGKVVPSLEFAYRIEKALKLVGELSDIVIRGAKFAAGIIDEPAAPASPKARHQTPLSPISLDAVCLSQPCPSCGGKVQLTISLSA